MKAALIPHKRALARLGLSRTTVWRAMNSQIADFPAPVLVRKRIYWHEEDLPRLEQAMLRYAGRTVFEAQCPRTTQHADTTPACERVLYEAR